MEIRIGCLHTLLTGKLGKVSLAKNQKCGPLRLPNVMTSEEESRFRVLLDLGKLTLLVIILSDLFKTSIFRDPLSPFSLIIVLNGDDNKFSKAKQKLNFKGESVGNYAFSGRN